MNIRTIWSSKFRNNIDYDLFSEIEFDKQEEVIGFKLLADHESLEQWRQKMNSINHSNVTRLS